MTVSDYTLTARRRALTARLVVLFACLLWPSGTLAQAQGRPTSPPPDGDAVLKAGTLPVPGPPAGTTLPKIAPVIGDDEFDAAIPTLPATDDPELSKPLESIAEFERRLAAEVAPAEAAADGAASPVEPSTAQAPVLDAGGSGDAIADAPVRDAELLKPLPPIDSFNVEPVEFAETKADDAEVDVAYGYRLEGLEQADHETEADLASSFRALSALRGGDGKAANVAMISARTADDANLLRQLLSAEGWYEPKIDARVDLADGSADHAYQAVLTVDPGRRYTLASIAVVAADTVPPGLIEQSLALRIGEPIVAHRILGAEANVALALPQSGYAFAASGQREIVLDRQSGAGDYRLPVTIGPLGRFGTVATEGNLAFDADHVAQLARFRPGELYDSRKVDDLREALVATGLFATVSAEPLRSGTVNGDGTEAVGLLVRQQSGPARTIAATAGYGSGEGLHVEGSWTHRNMFPPEGALIVSGIAGSTEQGAGVRFRRANAGKRDRSFEVLAEARHSNYDAYNANTGRLAARMAYDSTPIWQKRLTWAAGVELLASAEKDFDPAAGKRTRRKFYVAGLGGEVGLDYSDSLLDPTRGFRLGMLVEPEGSLGGGFHPYVRARVDGSAYIPTGENIVIAGRARVGTIQGVARDDIAPSRRLYAGGGGSVRGYGYQLLGPIDPLGDPLGGRSLFEASGELRYRFGTFGLVGFVDAGQSYESATPRFIDVRWGAGIGARFYSNFGPMRIDLATPVGRRKGESRINVYVSIGQAF